MTELEREASEIVSDIVAACAAAEGIGASDWDVEGLALWRWSARVPSRYQTRPST
jgi:hypothetical protein